MQLTIYPSWRCAQLWSYGQIFLRRQCDLCVHRRLEASSLTFRVQRLHCQAHLYKYVHLNLLKPTGHVMHQQFNIQQLYVLPTL